MTEMSQKEKKIAGERGLSDEGDGYPKEHCNFTVYRNKHRQRGSERIIGGRVVDGVDVIGVRSVSEAAENQSFIRTTGSACFRTE